VKWLEPQKRERRLWAREGNRRIKRLRAKMRHARVAVGAVRDYLAKLDVPIGTPIREILSRAVTVLDSAGLNEAEDLIAFIRKTEPAEDGMLALYDFFVSDCRLKKNEAEVRVAKIGNQLWDWNVAVIETPRRLTDERKGCEAVRKAVERKKPSWDISRKKS
jgi:hypothetical protein